MHDDSLEARLGETDLDLAMAVLSLNPELEATARALKLRRNRAAECQYPIVDKEALFRAYEGDEVILGNHTINLQMIQRYIDDHLFPIQNDRELAEAIYIAFSRCNSDVAWASQAPPHAHELLNELAGLEIDGIAIEGE